MAVPSMAAAIAASLPTTSSAPAPSAGPTHEAIPASMAKVIDVEAEIPVTSVQLDGLVVSKIIKHAGDTRNATGLLLGLDLDGVLEISNSFPLPHAGAEDEDKTSAKSMSRYQNNMLRSLKEVQGDDSVIGFYVATAFSAFFTHHLLDMQVAHQERLRQGGAVLVHDTTQAQRGNATFRAFRLTRNYLAAHKKGEFGSSSLASHRLTFATILEEIPLKTRTNALLSAFVTAMTTPTESAPAAVQPAFSSLDLGATSLSRILERTIEAVDASRSEENNIAYHSRQITRARALAEGALQKRRDENTIRVAQGLQALPEDDVLRAYKVPPEPSRLEGMLLLGQIEAHGKALEGAASIGIAKMHAAKTSVDV